LNAATNEDGTTANAWKLASSSRGGDLDDAARATRCAGPRRRRRRLPAWPSTANPSIRRRIRGRRSSVSRARPITLTIAREARPRQGREGCRSSQTLTSEDSLSSPRGVESKRKRVEELSGGKVGYLYVPNTGVDGQSRTRAPVLWPSARSPRSSSTTVGTAAVRSQRASSSC
jgi:hypothetical protein